MIPALRAKLEEIKGESNSGLVPNILRALSQFQRNLEAEAAIGVILDHSQQNFQKLAAQALTKVSRTEARAQQIQEVERLGKLTAFALLSLAVKLKQQQLQELMKRF